MFVSYTDDDDIGNGSKFAAEGVQIAAGVPLECGEGPEFKTFRIGLFGLDKLRLIRAQCGKFSGGARPCDPCLIGLDNERSR